MIKPICFQCEKELDNFGAILLSPPSTNSEAFAWQGVVKMHLCKDCYFLILNFINHYGNTTETTKQ